MPTTKPTPTPSTLTPALRRFLFATAAITGASILVIEILGAKMLAPYFGTSHFVWTAQIGVTMVALAAGYYLGGRLADRYRQLGILYGAVLLAALYLCLSVRSCQWMCYQCLRLPLAPGSLLASTLLYFIPLTLLAMTGPFFTRVLSVSVDSVGTLVGKISSISTLGSVLGTVLIGYVLIPFLPNSVTMYATACVLAGVAGAYWLGWGKSGAGNSTGLAGAILVFLLVFTGAQAEKVGAIARGGELFRGNSNFGQMQVWQNAYSNRRLYLNDFLVQNTYDTVEKKSVSLFTYMLHGLAKAYNPKLAGDNPNEGNSTNTTVRAAQSGPGASTARIRRVLCIGLGVGIVPMLFAREGAAVDVVEINPAVVELGKRFFDLQPDKLNLMFGDGRALLNRLSPAYDAIVLDAFLGDSSPAHLMSREAFQAMRRLLQPSGVLVINSFCDFTPGRDFYAGSLYKTLSSVFGKVIIHDGATGNVFFVASPATELGPPRVPSLDPVHLSCRQAVQDTFARVMGPPSDAGIVLTDDFNPVDFHDASNREHLRRQLALSMAPY